MKHVVCQCLPCSYSWTHFCLKLSHILPARRNINAKPYLMIAQLLGSPKPLKLQVSQVVMNLKQAASLPDLFRRSDALELLRSPVDAVRDQAAEVMFRFRNVTEQVMIRCLKNLEKGNMADLCDLNSETLQQKASDARRSITVRSNELDLRFLQKLMVFGEKTFTDMKEAGRLLLRLIPVVHSKSLAVWHENYRLFRHSDGVFETEDVLTCAQQLLSQQVDETLQLVVVDLLCEVLQEKAVEQNAQRALSLELIAETPQVLGPVSQCLKLLVSCLKGENILQMCQQEDAVAQEDEDIRRLQREVALVSQEMCGCRPEHCHEILKRRHREASQHLLKVAGDDQARGNSSSAFQEKSRNMCCDLAMFLMSGFH